MRRRAMMAGGIGLLVVAALVVTAVEVFPAHTVGRAASGPIRLPSSLAPWVFQSCEPDLGSLPSGVVLSFGETSAGNVLSVGLESPEAWVVEASRAGVTASGSNVALGGSDAQQASQAVAIAQKIYTCLSRYAFVDGSTPYATSSELVQQYKYDTVVLWPCLKARGLNVGPGPSRKDFSDPIRAQSVDPFRGLDVTRYSLPRLASAVHACPLRPSYLH